MKKVVLTLAGFVSCFGLAFAQWADNPHENMLFYDNNVYETEIAALEDGSFYTMFNEPHKSIFYYLTYNDKDGRPLWDEPLLLSDKPTKTYTVVNNYLFLDNEDNAIVTVVNAVKDTINLFETYTVFKVNKEGEHLWGENGLDLQRGELPYLSAHLQTIQLTDGSYVFAWMEGDVGGNLSIKMQRLSVDGEILWTEPKILKEENVNYAYPYLVAAPDNEFLMMYARGSSQELYAQKYDFDGNAVWAQPTLVYGSGFGSIPIWTFLDVIPANGGMLVGWYADPNGDNVEDVYIAYVKNDGSHAFLNGSEGLKVGYTEIRQFSPKMAFDAEKELIFVMWRETNSSQGIQGLKTQLVSAEGELMWNPEGIPVRPAGEFAVGYYSVKPGPDHAFAGFYMIEHSAYDSVCGYAFLQNSDATPAWSDSTIVFTDIRSNKSSLIVSDMKQNQWICIWDDNRRGSSVDDTELYAQNINIDGTLGLGQVSNVVYPKASPLKVSLRANPVSDFAQMQVLNESGAARMKVSMFDLQGRQVDVWFDGTLPAGESTISWNRKSSLVSGMYLLCVEMNGRVQYVKIILR